MGPLDQALGLRVGRLADEHLGAQRAAEGLALAGQLGCAAAPPADRALPVPHQHPRHRARALDAAATSRRTGPPPARDGISTRRQPPGVPGDHRQHRQLLRRCGSGRTRPAARSAGTRSRTGRSRPARYLVRDAGSGGRYTGRSSAHPLLEHRRSPRAHPIRSAITVAGIVGNACSSSRIRGSTASTTDPAGRRSYLGGPSRPAPPAPCSSSTPSTRAITLIGIPSARCSRRISAQSSTDNTPSSPARLEPGSRQGVKIRPSTRGQFSGAVDMARSSGPHCGA